MAIEHDKTVATETPHEMASPPCLMHEVDPAYFGLAGEPQPRKAETPAAAGAEHRQDDRAIRPEPKSHCQD